MAAAAVAAAGVAPIIKTVSVSAAGAATDNQAEFPASFSFNTWGWPNITATGIRPE